MIAQPFGYEDEGVGLVTRPGRSSKAGSCLDLRLSVQTDAALNERDYGALAGLNKTQARARFGVEQVRRWRKSYEATPPGGESLAMTAARVVPFFQSVIAPRVQEGGCVLLVAHGNSLRSLLMHLDHLGPGVIDDVNIATGEVLVYRMTADGRSLNRTTVLATAS